MRIKYSFNAILSSVPKLSLLIPPEKWNVNQIEIINDDVK